MKRRTLLLHGRAAAAAGLAVCLSPRLAFASSQPPAWLPGGFRLAGSGILRWFGLRVYEARLWVPESGIDPVQFQSAPFALQITYSRALDGKDIARASHDEMTRLQAGDPATLERWLAQMNHLFPDVQESDTLTGINNPGLGVAFLHNGKPLGSIADARFSTAFFAIWLDPRTSKPALREQLIAAAHPQRQAKK